MGVGVSPLCGKVVDGKKIWVVYASMDQNCVVAKGEDDRVPWEEYMPTPWGRSVCICSIGRRSAHT